MRVTTIRGAWALLASAPLLTGVATASAAGHDCTYVFPEDPPTHGWLPAEYEPVAEGVRICGGDEHANYVHTIDGGTFEGGGGHDRVQDMYGGTFRGGDDGDDVIHMYGGAFAGGDARDVVVAMSMGTFEGEDGGDHVFDLEGGTFDGGDGSDGVTLMQGGTFDGGDGGDWVTLMEGGTFDGGPGFDEVRGYCAGDLSDVELVTPLTGCQ